MIHGLMRNFTSGDLSDKVASKYVLTITKVENILLDDDDLKSKLSFIEIFLIEFVATKRQRTDLNPDSR